MDNGIAVEARERRDHQGSFKISWRNGRLLRLNFSEFSVPYVDLRIYISFKWEAYKKTRSWKEGNKKRFKGRKGGHMKKGQRWMRSDTKKEEKKDECNWSTPGWKEVYDKAIGEQNKTKYTNIGNGSRKKSRHPFAIWSCPANFGKLFRKKPFKN